MDDGIPFERIEKEFERWKTEEPNSRKTPIVLLSTGALCPVHRMHVKALEIARAFVEANCDNVVLGGWLSPTHDHYVTRKLARAKYSSISGIHRAAMIDAALSDEGNPLFACSRWEINQSKFVDFPQVVEEHERTILKVDKLKDSKVELWYVCGLDHFLRCGLMHGSMRVIVLARKGQDARELKEVTDSLAKFPKRSIILVNESFITTFSGLDFDEDFSSTKVRELMTTGAPLDAFCPKPVVEYIKTNGISFVKL